MILVAFPGQGSQTVGMAKDLFNKFLAAREVFKEAEDVLGWSLRSTIFDGTEAELKKTNVAQPALFTTCIALLKCLECVTSCPIEKFASFVLGHSLGQCTAICAAGALNFATCLDVVKVRGELMAKAHEGSMMACLNVPEDVLLAEVKKASAVGTCSIANYNSSTQVVVSGQIEALNILASNLKVLGHKSAPLNVSGAFHSILMNSAEKEFEQFLTLKEFRKTKLPVIDASTAEPADDIKRSLHKQLTSPVLWKQSVDYCLERSTENDKYFLEIGPKGVLTSLAKRDGKPFSFLNLFDSTSLDACAVVISKVINLSH